MNDPWAEPLTKRHVEKAESTSSSDISSQDGSLSPPAEEYSDKKIVGTRKRSTTLLPNPEHLLDTDKKRPKFLDPEALRDVHSHERPVQSPEIVKAEESTTPKEFDIARMAPPLSSKLGDSSTVIKSKALVYAKNMDDAPRTDPKKPQIKEKEKSKRMKGQSTHASWKSEGEMLLRQQYD